VFSEFESRVLSYAWASLLFTGFKDVDECFFENCLRYGYFFTSNKVTIKWVWRLWVIGNLC
jgi:hypothetical protein